MTPRRPFASAEVADSAARDREREPGRGRRRVAAPDLTERRAFQARQVDLVNAALDATAAATPVIPPAKGERWVNKRSSRVCVITAVTGDATRGTVFYRYVDVAEGAAFVQSPYVRLGRFLETFTREEQR